jgi:hypothetical protein
MFLIMDTLKKWRFLFKDAMLLEVDSFTSLVSSIIKTPHLLSAGVSREAEGSNLTLAELGIILPGEMAMQPNSPCLKQGMTMMSPLSPPWASSWVAPAPANGLRPVKETRAALYSMYKLYKTGANEA